MTWCRRGSGTTRILAEEPELVDGIGSAGLVQLRPPFALRTSTPAGHDPRTTIGVTELRGAGHQTIVATEPSGVTPERLLLTASGALLAGYAAFFDAPFIELRSPLGATTSPTGREVEPAAPTLDGEVAHWTQDGPPREAPAP